MLLNLDHMLTVINWTGAGLPRGAASVLWWDKSAWTGTPSEAAGELVDGWTLYLKGEVSSAVTMESVDYWYGTDGEAISGQVTGGGPGAGAADPDPPQVAYLIHKVGVTGGRHGRGRWYHPGVPAADTSIGGTLGTTAYNDFQADLNSLYTHMTTGVVDEPLVPIITQSPYAASNPVVEVGSFELDGRVGTIRRRNRR